MTSRAERGIHAHSGRLTSVGALITLSTGIAAAVPLGIVYGYGVQVNPFIVLDLGLLGLTAGALGWAVCRGAVWGHVRNRTFVRVAGLVAGCATLYVSWVTWFASASNGSVLPFAPDALLREIFATTDEGAWSLAGYTPTGAVLLGVWVVEALVLTVFGSSMVIEFFDDECYCELCSRWADDTASYERFTTDGLDAALDAVRAGDLAPLCALPRSANDDAPHATVQVRTCRGCRQTCVLGVEVATPERKGKKTRWTTRTVLHRQLVPVPTRADLDARERRLADAVRRLG